jgi:hypothetical protein
MRALALFILALSAGAPAGPDEDGPELYGDHFIDRTPGEGKADGVGGGPPVLFLNFRGVTLGPGQDDPEKGTSMIVKRRTTFPPFDVSRHWLNTSSTEEAIRIITSTVAGAFQDFGVKVVTERPASGPYTMIVITSTDARSVDQDPAKVQGIAPLDCGDRNPRNIGFAFRIEDTWIPYPKWHTAMTIAHEAGHSFGLVHNSASLSIMNIDRSLPGTIRQYINGLGWFAGTNAERGFCAPGGYVDAAPGQPLDDRQTLVENLAGTRKATTEVLLSRPANLVAGSDVELAALVRSTTGDQPTGKVTFVIDGGAQLGPAALDDGRATVRTRFTVGRHEVRVSYSGDMSHLPIDGKFPLDVEAAPSTPRATQLVLSSSKNPSLPDEEVTFTARIDAGGSPASGTITFSQDGQKLGSPVPINGQVTLVARFSAAGSHLIEAAFEGGASFASATAKVMQQVGAAVDRSTQTTLTLPSQPRGENDDIELRATVVSSDGRKPMGTVTFLDGVLRLGEATLDAAGAALIKPSFQGRAGSHPIKVVYSGDADHDRSESMVSVLEIAAAPAAMPGGAGGSSAGGSSAGSPGGISTGSGGGLIAPQPEEQMELERSMERSDGPQQRGCSVSARPSGDDIFGALLLGAALAWSTRRRVIDLTRRVSRAR